MKVFIDFDDVLFNTKKFIEDIEVIFQKHGISKNIFYETYQSEDKISKTNYGNMFSYSPSLQFKKIKKKIKIDTKQLEKDFNVLVKNTKKYIFKDVDKFLNKMGKKDIFILSFGTNNFQKEKIKNSGIEKYFNKIIVVAYAEKSRAIGKIIGKSRESFYFIDDRVSFLEEVKNKYHFSKTFLIRRKEGRYGDKKNKYCDFSANNLRTVLKIIKENAKK
ncbi:MAG TPA: hypothetical protein P5548_03555 [Candidatus Moranbacteria bacterium]|nr:hypothetical protein [Candidatus Moranbacteria bacterium]HRZ33945.1 hypothetical protein [Candidatus Moranbacteria bacterium]